MQKYVRALAIFLLICIISQCTPTAFTAETGRSSISIEKAVEDTGAYLLKTVNNPQVGSIGGEWAVIGLAHSGCPVPPSWYETYYRNLVASVRKNDGILHEKKYTEYSRVILALTVIGRDPTDVGGYNLLDKLGDYNKVIWQGINGPIFALIALNSGNYQVPVCKGAEVQTTRKLLIDQITSQQLPDGGFSLEGETADPDITAMVLQALAPYKEQIDIKAVIDRALNCLSNLQNSDGGYSNNGLDNSESTVQVLVSLTGLGINPDTDTRFIKRGCSVVDNLMNFYVSGGGFKNATDDAGPNGMATEQGFYGLVAYKRFLNGKNGLYDMSYSTDLTGGGSSEKTGLPDKNPDVKRSPIISPGKTFNDIAGSESKETIEALAARRILNGVSNTSFEPGRTMTRAEFAAVVVRALGLTPLAKPIFSDVMSASWYAPYVGTAYTYGIITGTSKYWFSPENTITREQAAVMVTRAARLCGMDIEMTNVETRDVLAQFPDYMTSSTWARGALAFCYQNDILSQKVVNIRPQEAVTRTEIAHMIYIMLQKANLI
ncbi:MAG: hypothetical protein XD78_1093 [Desulfotomaculum sp. 46_296]|nr:MAG: hypothetical protein XD78_1093 [Desulfotomaculum sp. 46_296]HAU31426.1 hypothetical protein [Desulfotomaculum sp.]